VTNEPNRHNIQKIKGK